MIENRENFLSKTLLKAILRKAFIEMMKKKGFLSYIREVNKERRHGNKERG